MTKAKTNGKPVNLKEIIGSTPIHKELAHVAGDNHGSGYNKYSSGVYERDIGYANYPPPPPPPPRSAPYGSDYSHYSGPPGYAAGPYAGLPPPPPPPPSHGTHHYHRGELYDLPPPPPPGAGQYGHLRANPPPDLAQWEEPIGSYGPPAAYHHQSAGLPHSILYAPYCMPPPPPPGPQISPRTAASNGNGVYDNGYGGYSNGNSVHHSNGNSVLSNGKGVHSNGNNNSGTITTVVQPDRQPSSGVAKSVANGVKHMEPLVDSKTTPAKPDSPMQAAAPDEAPVTKPTPAVEKVEEEQEKKSIVTEVPLIADTPLEPTPSTVKNAFAERLAQQALARLASRASGGTVRTDLLRGTQDIAAAPAIIVTPAVPDKIEVVAPKVEALVVEKSTIPVARASPPPSPRASVVHEPIVNSAVHSPSKDSLASKDSVGEDNRPRLKLQPRTLPVDAAAAAAAASAGVDDGRRRLQLAPRSKADTSGSDPHASKAASIFGAARPREMVLKERGVDAALADLDLAPTKSYGSSTAPHHGYAASSARGSRTASVTSGHSDEHRQGDQWQTVSKGKSRNREDSYVPVNYDNDPLLNAFGHTSHSNVPSRFFGEGGSGFLGGRSNDNYRFGSPANTSFTGSYGRNQDNTSDGIVIRRSLPLRSDF